MKAVILFLIAIGMCSCASTRFLGKDCQKLDKLEQWNCEKVQEL